MSSHEDEGPRTVGYYCGTTDTGDSELGTTHDGPDNPSRVILRKSDNPEAYDLLVSLLEHVGWSW